MAYCAFDREHVSLAARSRVQFTPSVLVQLSNTFKCTSLRGGGIAGSAFPEHGTATVASVG